MEVCEVDRGCILLDPLIDKLEVVLVVEDLEDCGEGERFVLAVLGITGHKALPSEDSAEAVDGHVCKDLLPWWMRTGAGWFIDKCKLF